MKIAGLIGSVHWNGHEVKNGTLASENFQQAAETVSSP
jgi:predicted negative regulator of RcsB-dependent stress response